MAHIEPIARILVVEDNEAHALLVRFAFDDYPKRFLLEVSGTLHDAKRVLGEFRPDLVISDMCLPDGRGIELIPNSPGVASYPVIIMTAHGDEKVAVESMKAGALDYIVKSDAVFSMLPQMTEFALREWQHRTERLRAEERLRVSEEQYRSLIENLNVGIFRSTLDHPGRFIRVNTAMAKIFGFSTAELLIETSPTMLYENPADRETLVNRILSAGSVRDSELLLRKRDGTPLWAAVTAKTGRDADGSVKWMDGIIEDITERKRLEEQLRQAQKMEAIGTLAGGVAHDFNNILTAIMGYGTLLKLRLAKDHPSKSYIEAILSSSEKAAHLTQSLLAFSRKQIISPKPVDLNEIVRRIDKLLMRVIGEDIEFKTILADTDLIVMADNSQIEQVLMNLSANARDAMPGGGILTIRTDRVDLRREVCGSYDYVQPGAYAVLSVSDTGKGMDSETRQRIFEPFFTTKEVGKGTGLGLSIVYGIIKQHNGEINVYSEPGKGTIFKIYLKLVKSRGEDVEAAVLPLPVGGSETILVAEDDADVRTLMKNILVEFGYTVIEAVDGEDAICKFIENSDKIQLLILDVVMPKKNGKEAYEEMKKVKNDIRVLFSSGYTADIIHKKGVLEEGINFISKPVPPHILLTKVREALSE